MPATNPTPKPGQTITYTATITNTGSSDATGMAFSDTPDANTTLVNGSVHASPVATNDTYNWVGNTFLDTSARSLASVTANDTAPTDSFTVTTINNGATTQGGNVTLLSNGHFTYTPPVGFTGADTFTYTIKNSAVASLTTTATVTINLTGRVWYVQNGAANGNGLSSNPFNSPSSASTAANASSDIIYIFSDIGANAKLNGNFALDNSQQLLGQGVGLTVNSINLFSVGSAPTITNSSGGAVTLGSGNTLSGFNIGNTSGTAIIGSSVGTLNISSVSVNTTGAGLDLTGVSTPTVNVTLGGLTSSGGSKNVNLVGLNGTISLGSGALSNASGTAFNVSGGGASVTYAGTITQNTAGQRAVNIDSTTGGSVSFAGTVTSSSIAGGVTSTGVNINNANGNVSFSTLNIGTSGTRTTAQAVTVTGGSGTKSLGVVSIFTSGASGVGIGSTSSTGAISTTSGTVDASGAAAINIVGVSAASKTPLNMQLTKVSANGGSNGIFLQNTSSTGSPGGFVVTGNSSGQCGGVANPAGSPTAPDANDCTGGVIQNTTGADGATAGNGIYLNNAQSVSLTRVKINDHQNNGIYGTGVTGLTISNSLFNGNNGNSNSGAFEESSLHLVDTGGTVKLLNSTINGGADDGFLIRNTTSAAPTLAIEIAGVVVSQIQGSVMDVRNTALQMIVGNSPVNAGDPIPPGGGTITANIHDNNLTFWWGNAIHLLVKGNASGIAKITGNRAAQTSGALAGAGGIWVNGGDLTYEISGNHVQGTNGTAISADKGQLGKNLNGTIDGNTIGTSGVSDSGSQTGTAIFASHTGINSTTVKISNNVIRQIAGSASGAITIITGDDVGSGTGSPNGAGTMNATVVGNNIQESGPPVNNAQQGILITHGRTTNDSDQGCYDIGGAGALANSITNFTSGTANNRIRVNQRFLTTSRWPGYIGAATGATSQTDLGNYLLSRNTASTSLNANSSTGGFLNTVPAGSVCPQPSAVVISMNVPILSHLSFL
ncbi:MAG: hypothetical protein AUG51_14295 [Acidobacteria bacterium 13_1_20CM_3_53_8]|nr:MAG: hypothetical protein AUG51_14295 [Acidobacteria bacterium 13_1_20CM_3_53_8]